LLESESSHGKGWMAASLTIVVKGQSVWSVSKSVNSRDNGCQSGRGGRRALSTRQVSYFQGTQAYGKTAIAPASWNANIMMIAVLWELVIW